MSSLVINTNLSAIQAYDNLTQTNNALDNAISQLSSGLAVQTAADNPAGYVTAEALQYQQVGYTQASANAQNGVSLIQTAEGALNQITSVLQTMDQLALNSANGATTDSTALSANQAEFSKLQNEINQIANTTSFGTTQLLSGTFTGQVLQVGAFDNSNQQITLSISGATASDLGIASSSVGTVAGAQTAIASVQAAINTVDAIEANVGALQNELQAVITNLQVGGQNLQAAHSAIVDTNFAKETTAFTTQNILMQSGVAVLSAAQQQPGLALKLLANV